MTTEIEALVALAALEKAICYFPWSYWASDDDRHYQAGIRAKERLNRLWKDAPSPEREELWHRLAPIAPSGERYPMPGEFTGQRI